MSRYAHRMTQRRITWAAVRAVAALLILSVPLADAAFAQRGGGGRGGGGVGEAPQTGRGQPQGPRVVGFDFLATTADGGSVTDLDRDEVTLAVGGRARNLRSLTYVSVPTGSLPVPYGSSQVATRRRILLIFDEGALTPRALSEATEEIVAFVAGLPASDRIGIGTLPAGTVSLAPTANRAAIAAALGNVSARGLGGAEDEPTAVCRTRNTLESLRDQLMALGDEQGFTGVVFFSAALMPAGARPGELGGPLVDQACEVSAQLYEDVHAAVDSVGLQFRVVQPVENVGDQRHQGLQAFAAAAGAGEVLLLSPASNPLPDLVRRWSGYYVATFEPNESEQTGERRRVELTVSREDVTVTARSTLVIPAQPAIVTPQGMLQVPDAFREVPLRVVGIPQRLTMEQPDQIKVVVLAEGASASASLDAAAAGLVSTGADEALQVVSVEPGRLTVSPLILAIETAPGVYRLRFAATDDDLGGAADFDLDATLRQAGPYRFSGMLLGTTVNGAFQPRLQFRDEAAVVAYDELYGDLAAGGGMNVWMELAETPGGEALRSVVPGGQATAEADRISIVAEIPIDDLAPGDYVARTVIEFPDAPRLVLSQTLRKVD